MKYVVYWIRLPEHTDYNTQGYIGITKNFNTRLTYHKRKAPNPHFRFAIAKYGWDNLVKEVIVDSLNQEAAELIELMLRPSIKIGWNTNKGGNDVPSFKGYTHTEKAKTANSNSKQGTNNPSNKLSPENIIEIYKRILNNETNVSIALLFNIADTTIAEIKYGKKPYYKNIVNAFKQGVQNEI